jgi:hypothetical protein
MNLENPSEEQENLSPEQIKVQKQLTRAVKFLDIILQESRRQMEAIQTGKTPFDAVKFAELLASQNEIALSKAEIAKGMEYAKTHPEDAELIAEQAHILADSLRDRLGLEIFNPHTKDFLQ